ncbi:MAG: RNase-H-2 domain-containing protein [Sporanaerobacter sp.]|jgi:uncharacterized protein|uniref:ribonuclease H-like domain-containing protein n=1 Tax=Sporanaerobacter sp. TaxID=2010183 RepID=UPI003A0FCBEB
MDTLYSNVQYNLDLKKYFKNSRICFFDIETTGFSRNNDTVYLVGILSGDDGKYTLKQYLLESIGEEMMLLKTLIPEFKNSDYIINFNGDSFDIPFLNHKYKKYNIDYEIPISKSIDIYKIVKDNKYLFEIENLKLKSIEKYLNINRDDELSGGQCISLFYDYINNKNEQSKKLILKHNYDDIYYLPHILKILDVIEEKSTIQISHEKIKNKFLKIKMKNFQISNDMININCVTDKFPKEPIIVYGNSYNFNWEQKKGMLRIQFQIEHGILSNMKKCIYVNLENFEPKLNIKDNTIYNLPENIVLIQIEKNFIIDNIKNIILELFKCQRDVLFATY